MNKFKESIKRFIHFVGHEMWHITETELTRGKRVVYRIVKIAVLSVRGFFRDDLNVKASALSFSLLFAIVPIFALLLAISKGFGFQNVIEETLQGSVIGGTDVTPLIMGFVERYLETARGGVFLGVGIVVLLYSVYTFFQQVENSFNSIWEVKKSRSLVSQFTTYFSILLVVPILLVLSSGVSLFLDSILAPLTFLSPLVEFFIKLSPFLIFGITFTLLYLLVPNTKVKFGSACIAGFMAGIAFQLFQMLYVWGQVYLSRYNVVYGSFAAIPLLLLWLQVSSLIILLGAEISFITQNIRNFDYEVDTKNISLRYKNYIAMYVIYLVVKRFENQQPPITVQHIVDDNHLPIRLVTKVLNQLVDSGLLIEVYADTSHAKAFQPAMDINKLTVAVFTSKLESNGSELFINNKTDEMKRFWDKTLEMERNIVEKTSQLLIKDLI